VRAGRFVKRPGLAERMRELSGLYGSQERLDELIALAERGEAGAREALDRFEKEWKELPFVPGLEFVERMKRHADPKVARLAADVFGSTYQHGLVEFGQNLKRYVMPDVRALELLRSGMEERMSELVSGHHTIEGMEYNQVAYEVLVSMELLLRDLVRIVLGDQPGEKCNRLPRGMWADWVEKMDREREDRLVEASEDPVDYADFTDFRKIFEKGRNHTLFSEVATPDEFEAFISKLGEIEAIRIKVAHARPLTEEEFERLEMYFGDFVELFGMAVG